MIWYFFDNEKIALWGERKTARIIPETPKELGNELDFDSDVRLLCGLNMTNVLTSDLSRKTPKELANDFDFSSDIGLLCGLEMTSSTSELTKKNQNWWNWAGFRFWCWAVVWLLAITSKHLRIIHKTSKKELDFASDVGLFDLKHLPEDNPMNYHQRSSSSDLPRRFPGQPNLYHDNR